MTEYAADTIRRAANLMRARAKVASAQPWHVDDFGEVITADTGNDPWQNPVAGESNAPNAHHIASWHPGVTLAVADWLDCEARLHEEDRPDDIVLCESLPHALRVARTYLGEKEEGDDD